MTEVKSSRTRSSAYPSILLEQAVTLIKKLNTAMGPGPHSRELVAQGIGYTSVSGASAPKISALTHYGLLIRKNKKYTISQLANRIMFPTDDEDKKKALRIAMQNPKLYQGIIERFQGNSIPNMLDNILIQNFGINHKAAKNVAEVFRQSAIFTDIMQKDGYLAVNNTDPSTYTRETTEPGNLTPQTNVKLTTNRPLPPTGTLCITLPSGIIIDFPSDMSYHVSQGDFAAIIQQLENKIVELQKESKKNDEAKKQ